jgi:hypothetical protein
MGNGPVVLIQHSIGTSPVECRREDVTRKSATIKAQNSNQLPSIMSAYTTVQTIVIHRLAEVV